MKVFDHIAIIYNPKSTGDASKIAKDLADSVNGHFEVIQKKATLYPTKKAGDAIELAYDIASKHRQPLIVSVSGDGGYNEVINGVMAAKKLFPAQKPVVAVVGAGNANDHERVVRDGTPMIRLIKKAEIKRIDLISIKATARDYAFERYAHSYIGFGITPEVGHELNTHGKSRWNELWLTIKTIKNFQPFSVERDGATTLYDSMVFANINEMAKFVKLDATNTMTDNKFELVTIKHQGKLHTLRALASALIHGFQHAPSYSSYRFKLPDEQLVQVDGEVETLASGSTVTITSHSAAIHTLV